MGKRDHEVADLNAKLRALTATRNAEQAAAESERTALHEKIESYVKEVALLEAMMQTAMRKAL